MGIIIAVSPKTLRKNWGNNKRKQARKNENRTNQIN